MKSFYGIKKVVITSAAYRNVVNRSRAGLVRKRQTVPLLDEQFVADLKQSVTSDSPSVGDPTQIYYHAVAEMEAYLPRLANRTFWLAELTQAGASPRRSRAGVRTLLENGRTHLRNFLACSFLPNESKRRRVYDRLWDMVELSDTLTEGDVAQAMFDESVQSMLRFLSLINFDTIRQAIEDKTNNFDGRASKEKEALKMIGKDWVTYARKREERIEYFRQRNLDLITGTKLKPED
ncbi:hypothetical protein K402DRAFT_392090 [Aulographum hederae CBS 113979]|uniref:Uncharacterized protein n=1 Tax=Aulographum hederae CBS 113979 TaxID=1176131 RepID=A0A6G1H5Q9_9PEZI|nr:hypothetical protein K402DRAFT_392090 [Aulographum hederae CBS 113979]